MTRRPIFVAIATILALGLLVGLAYGTGRSSGSRTPIMAQSHDQHMGSAGTPQGTHFGPAFQMQLRTWMHEWMRDHHADHGWSADGLQGTPLGSHQGRNRSSGPTSGGGYNTGGHQTNRDHGSRDSGYGYGYGGQHDGGWNHDCR
jgi:hypothetical protein